MEKYILGANMGQFSSLNKKARSFERAIVEAGGVESLQAEASSLPQTYSKTIHFETEVPHNETDGEYQNRVEMDKNLQSPDTPITLSDRNSVHFLCTLSKEQVQLLQLLNTKGVDVNGLIKEIEDREVESAD